MSLVPYHIVSLADNDSINGRNVINGAAVTITQYPSGIPATIYSNESGTTPITLPTVTDINGELNFFIEEGEYTIYVGGLGKRASLARYQSSTIQTFSDLATTVPKNGQGTIVTILGHSFLGLGGGNFIARPGSVTNNGGTKINSATGGLYWDRINYETADFFMFGALGDGTTNDTAAIQMAANSGLDLRMPDGNFRVTDRIQFLTNQKIQGGGRTSSLFKISTDFNMSATAVVRMGTSETGAQLHDVGFIFTQADQSVRANVTEYPYAIDMNGIPRCIVDRIRIENGFKGIDARGNCGGSYLGFLEIGTLNTGIDHDGSFDFFHGGHWHFWPFGMAGSPNLMSIYYDGVGVAATFGRSDGLNIDSINTFSQKIVITAAASSTAIPIQISKLQLDGDGARLLVSGGVTQIGVSYSTKSSAAVVTSVNVDAGTLILSNHRVAGSLSSTELFTSGTGRLFVNGGELNFINPGHPVAQSNGGLLVLDGVSIIPSAGLAYTQPHCLQTAGVLQVKNCNWATVGAGSGIAVFYNSDQNANLCTGNNFGNWTYGLPSSYSLGKYDGNLRIFNGDVIGNLVVGAIKTKRLIVTTDATGAYTGAHGVTDLHTKVLSVSAYYRGNSGEAIPLTINNVSGGNLTISGATGIRRARVTFVYTETQDSW